MIVLGDRRERFEEIFTSVRWMAKVNHPYAMPYNNVDVYYCQGLKQPLAAVLAAGQELGLARIAITAIGTS